MRKLLLALFALAFAIPAQAQNYTATPGSGLTFGTKLISGVNYPQWVLCDPTTPSQCAAVNSSGQLSIAVASGAVASGAYSAGAFAAGAVVAGAFVDGWDLTQGAKADSAYAGSGSASVVAILKGIYASVNGSIPAGTALIGKVGIDQTTPGTTNGVQVNAALPAGTNTIGTVGWLPYPVGATAITASATGTTGATTATLAGTTGKTTYICGYSIRANATANTNVTDTVTGVITGTMSSALWVPANTAGLGVDEQIFSPCIPASATNTGIAAVSGAPGTGGVVTVKAWGFQL